MRGQSGRQSNPPALTIGHSQGTLLCVAWKPDRISEDIVVRRFLLPMMVVVLLAFGGCLKTVALIESNPPGAEVYYDTRLLPEKTPTTIDVAWYGEHTVTFVREGYPPSKYVIDIEAPKHLWIPLDFFVTILPFTVTDRHEFHFDLDETQAKGE